MGTNYTAKAFYPCRIACKCPNCGETVIVDQTLSRSSNARASSEAASDEAYRVTTAYVDGIIAQTAALSRGDAAGGYDVYFELGDHPCPKCHKVFDWCRYTGALNKQDHNRMISLDVMVGCLIAACPLTYFITRSEKALLVGGPLIAGVGILQFIILSQRFRNLKKQLARYLEDDMAKVTDRETLPLVCSHHKVPFYNQFDEEAKKHFIALYGDNPRAQLLKDAKYSLPDAKIRRHWA